MHQTRQTPLVSAICAALIALLVLPVAAGAKEGRGKGRGHKSHPAKQATDAYAKGGPPPWAPAHGYRRGRSGGEATAYVAPFGIDMGVCNRELLGAALGGAAGGLLASEIAKGDDRPAAILGGAILGALLGGAIGSSMDGLDQGCLGQVLEHTPSHETVVWENPDRQADYRVTPVRTWEEPDGQYCREYQTTVTIGGKLEQAYGKACRQPDGSWKRVG